MSFYETFVTGQPADIAVNCDRHTGIDKTELRDEIGSRSLQLFDLFL